MLMKCDRCKGLETAKKGAMEAERLYESQRGKRGAYVDWCKSRRDAYMETRDALELIPCTCYDAEEPTLPLGNTGVKMGAFSEGIAQRRKK